MQRLVPLLTLTICPLSAMEESRTSLKDLARKALVNKLAQDNEESISELLSQQLPADLALEIGTEILKKRHYNKTTFTALLNHPGILKETSHAHLSYYLESLLVGEDCFPDINENSSRNFQTHTYHGKSYLMHEISIIAEDESAHPEQSE